jgi:hypothetical protein
VRAALVDNAPARSGGDLGGGAMPVSGADENPHAEIRSLM